MTNNHGPAFLKRLREVYKNYNSSLLLTAPLSQNGRDGGSEDYNGKGLKLCAFCSPTTHAA